MKVSRQENISQNLGSRKVDVNQIVASVKAEQSDLHLLELAKDLVLELREMTRD